MGRLTLNMLLSFAQYEREITGERIRDKIAASKARGLWMGGPPLLGYHPRGRTLQIDPKEAEIVVSIFQRYLELGSVHALQKDLKERGIRSKRWINKAGEEVGGNILHRGALYHLLRNRHYIGEIVHGEKTYPGQHQGIIPLELFEAVQQRLTSNSVDRRDAPLRPGASPLTGLVFDDAGNRMSPTHGRGAGGKPHRYYVSRALLSGDAGNAGSLRRAPAAEVEALLAERFSDRDAPVDWKAVRAALERVELGSDKIKVKFNVVALSETMLRRLRDQDGFSESEGALIISARFGARSGAVRLLDPDGRAMVDHAEVNQGLVRALARGWRWRKMLLAGEFASTTALAESEGVARTIIHQCLRLAYLAPDIIREFLEGRERPGLSLNSLLALDLPREWAAQRRLLATAPLES